MVQKCYAEYCFYVTCQREIICQNQEIRKNPKRKNPRKRPKKRNRQNGIKRKNDPPLSMDSAIPFEKIAAQAISTGASLVGVVEVATLLNSPSHRLHTVDRKVCEACYVVVLALAHTAEQAEMDWWDGQKGGTPGSRRLIDINRRLTKWFRKEYGAEAYGLPYQAIGGGIFLKDAAVLAGLGVIGKNNLLITPQYGPRVRLRALLLNQPLKCTEPLADFAPCDGCGGPCMQACPREAFQGGFFQSKRCLLQMKKDETDKVALKKPVVWMPDQFRIVYCRLCELSCPVGH